MAENEQETTLTEDLTNGAKAFFTCAAAGAVDPIDSLAKISKDLTDMATGAPLEPEKRDGPLMQGLKTIGIDSDEYNGSSLCIAGNIVGNLAGAAFTGGGAGIAARVAARTAAGRALRTGAAAAGEKIGINGAWTRAAAGKAATTQALRTGTAHVAEKMGLKPEIAVKAGDIAAKTGDVTWDMTKNVSVGAGMIAGGSAAREYYENRNPPIKQSVSPGGLTFDNFH